MGDPAAALPRGRGTVRFDLQGHRGARGLFPENTLEGFAAAAGLGLDSFEIDIAVTRDGVAVLHHDTGLNPDIARRGGAWVREATPIRSLTAAELTELDVGRIRPGSDYAARYAGQVAVDGARIPTLAALLAAQPAARFNIELKLTPPRTIEPDEMVDCVLATVDAAGATGRVTVQSFDWRAPRLVARRRPDIPRGWLTDADADGDAVPGAIADAGGGTWTAHGGTLTEAALRRAHRLGLPVVPWTVNDPADMRRLLAWGVDGLITDYPDRALPLLA